MHEWRLAEVAIESALRIARDRGIERITSVSLTLGELQHIEPAIFADILRQIATTRDPMIAAARFDVKPEAILLRCRRCGRTWGGDITASPRPFHGQPTDIAPAIHDHDHDLDAMHHLMPEAALAGTQCPDCSSADFELQKGRDVTLVSVTGSG